LIISADAPIATMLALRDRDDFTYVHSVNVGMLAGCQATAFGLSEKEAEAISIAGLLHDIGKSRVPEAILTKRAPLTLQEQTLLAAHAQEGAKMLLASQGGNRLAAIVASEHHRADAQTTNGATPLFASQVVAIADAFDSLRSLRPFDDRNATRAALAYMLGRLSSRFNPYLLSRFAVLCGMFETGDLANLTTGEVVRVVQPHPESALHPVVEVIDAAVGSLAVGTTVDLSRQDRNGKPRGIQLPITSTLADLDPRELDWLG
jgi:putative nucleotidyltransferase with HDIG domain